VDLEYLGELVAGHRAEVAQHAEGVQACQSDAVLLEQG
jgi:hypothetical protein